jgi:hypothetical protein
VRPHKVSISDPTIYVVDSFFSTLDDAAVLLKRFRFETFNAAHVRLNDRRVIFQTLIQNHNSIQKDSFVTRNALIKDCK